MEHEELPGNEPLDNEEPEEFCSFNGQKFASLDDLANSLVRDAATGDTDWYYHEIICFLYKWSDIFNHRFFSGHLPRPIISVEKARTSNYGHFTYGRNSLGLNFNINLNRRYLRRSEAELCETLLHEQLHLYQYMFGKPGRRNYHNKAFIQKAAEFGLQVEMGRGCHFGSPTEPFISLLRQRGVSFVPRVVRAEPPQAKEPKQRLRRWSCRCKSVWCGGSLTAMCLTCEQEFHPNPTMRGG
jgi:hypothetical protein